MGTGDLQYYRRRAEEELLAARTTSCAYARDVHLDLAERYSAKLRLMEALAGDASSAEPRQEAAAVRRTALG